MTMVVSKVRAPPTCAPGLPVSAKSEATFIRIRCSTRLRLQHRQHPLFPLGLPSILPVNPPRRRVLHPLGSTGTAQDDDGFISGTPEGSTIANPEPEGDPEESGQQGQRPGGRQATAAADATTEAIKEKLAAARAAGSGDAGGGFWDGFMEEVGRIEWPEFGKVLGTTGVVLSVIAGSSVALLTVNAILAELSDRVFAGRGLQDLFGG